MKVSVLIPSYNHAFCIQTAIQSVLDQTYSDFELLISDDCSQDGTRSVLSRFENNERIRVFYQPIHIGAVEQIHFLAEQASGTYIALLNSDDFWRKDKLQKQVAYLDEHPTVGACFTHAVYIDEDDQPLTKEQFALCDLFLKPNYSRLEWIDYFWRNGNCLCHPSVMARRGIYQGEYRLNQGLRQLPDYDLWTRYILNHHIHILQEPLTYYRKIQEKNVSARTFENTEMLFREQAWIRRKMLENLSEQEFKSVFGQRLKNRACQGMEVLCEKFFLLAQEAEESSNMHEQAIEYYLEHSTQKDFVRTMMATYSYSDSDFFTFVKSGRKDSAKQLDKLKWHLCKVLTHLREGKK